MMEDVDQGDSGILRLLTRSYIYWGIKKPTYMLRARYTLRKSLTRLETFISRLTTGSAQPGSEGSGE